MASINLFAEGASCASKTFRCATICFDSMENRRQELSVGMALAQWKAHSNPAQDLILKTNNQGDEFMPTGKRKESGGASVPLINFDEIAAERESFKLSWTVLANLRDYVAYVRDVTGRETTPDDVVDKGMRRLFDADKGFRQWLQKKNSESRNKTKHAKAEKPAKLEKPLSDGKAESSNDPFSRS